MSELIVESYNPRFHGQESDLIYIKTKEYILKSKLLLS